MRRAKIVATLGPSSNTKEQIKTLIEAGLDVARVNMSHGTYEGHTKVIANIRQASKEFGKEVAILMDLQGPKIRVDKLKENLTLKKGEIWVIGASSVQSKYPQYSETFIPTVYENLVEDAREGCTILFDDGLMEAKAIKKDGDVLQIEIINGGQLKSNKGINLPDVEVSAPSLTIKDREDLVFGLQQNVDYFALSFVRRREEIEEVKNIIRESGQDTPIISKIEKPEAIDNIIGIIEATDVIMIARGDMGVELGNHLVPAVQKKLIDLCNNSGVPVITATQMLESMIENPRPTRAEASDVANAIWDGTDAVMLSGETAAGKYPEETIKMMSQIILEAEKTPKNRPLLRDIDLGGVDTSLQVSASLIAENINAKKIVAITESGNSALKISRFRPKTPVLALTTSEKVARKTCLYWGVHPMLYQGDMSRIDTVQMYVTQRISKQEKLESVDKIVFSIGEGETFNPADGNSVRVSSVK